MCRTGRFLALALLLGCAAGCGSEPVPVGSLAVVPGDFDLPHASCERLELRFEATAPLSGLEGEARVALHLMDAAGRLQRTFDHPLPGDWVPGAQISYQTPVYQSALGPPLEPGEYALRAGLYDDGGRRWELESGRVAAVRVGDPGAGFPELSFSADWLPTEPGTDQQILARRWLAADGALRVRGITEAGALWLRLGIPGAGERQEMVLAAGAERPAVTVRADCSGLESELAGTGGHTLEIPLTTGGEQAGECRIFFAANFELVSTVNRETRTIALENVCWKSGLG